MFDPDTGNVVSHTADNRAMIAGRQVTDNRSNQILSGGFHITLSGTIRHFHRALQVPYGYAYWHSLEVSEGTMSCATTRLAGLGTTLQYTGHDAF